MKDKFEHTDPSLEEMKVIVDPINQVLDRLAIEYPAISEGFNQIMKEQFLLFAKKHLDYGLGNIAAGTQLETAEEAKFALTGLWYRISDKVNRWKNLMISEDKDIMNESVLDTFQDIANYAIIAQMVSRGMWHK